MAMFHSKLRNYTHPQTYNTQSSENFIKDQSYMIQQSACMGAKLFHYYIAWVTYIHHCLGLHECLMEFVGTTLPTNPNVG